MTAKWEHMNGTILINSITFLQNKGWLLLKGYINEKSSVTLFVSAEEAACNRINCLQ